MQIAVLADVHDCLSPLRRLLALEPIAKAEALILCGDLTHPAVLDACIRPGRSFSFCLGNCDQGRAAGLMKHGLMVGATPWAELGTLALPNGEQVAFVHYPAVARQAAETGQYKAVFFGHSHQPHEEVVMVNGMAVLLANPGDVQGRYGKHSALVWDSETNIVTKLEL